MKRKPKAETEQVMVWEDGALRFRTRPKWKNPHTFHTSAAFMDYLHGDVKEEEAWAACHYEYVRQSRAMWEAVKERDELRQSNPQVNLEEIVLAVFERHPGEWWAGNMGLLHFVMCESFPKKDWNELSEPERHSIMGGPPRQRVPPLPMTDVWTLKALRAFDRFSAMGESARPVVEDVPPGKRPKPIERVPPVLQQHGAVYHVIFTVDFSKGEAELANEFKEWLKLPGNQRLLEEHRKPTRGTTGKPLDRLKDLAAWRLWRELGNDWNKANEFANAHRKKFSGWPQIRAMCKKLENGKFQYMPGDMRPFRDAKRQGGKPANEAELFGEEADARKAKASALTFLTETMPEEFPPPPSGRMAEAFKELEKIASSS
jgi:hypothetical protein